MREDFTSAIVRAVGRHCEALRDESSDPEQAGRSRRGEAIRHAS